jgi:hypothetical protein
MLTPRTLTTTHADHNLSITMADNSKNVTGEVIAAVLLEVDLEHETQLNRDLTTRRHRPDVRTEELEGVGCSPPACGTQAPTFACEVAVIQAAPFVLRRSLCSTAPLIALAY